MEAEVLGLWELVELGSSVRAVCSLNHGVIPPGPHLVI